MTRRQAILDLRDPGASLKKRQNACEALRDLRTDEPNYEEGIDALMGATRAGSLIGEFAQSVLDSLNEQAYTEARAGYLRNVQEMLPEGTSDPTTLVSIFENEGESWDRRRSACCALAELNPPGAVQVFLSAFCWGDADMGFEAANALFAIR